MLYGVSLLYGLFGTTRVIGAGGIGAQLTDVSSRLFVAHAFGGQPAAQLALVVAVVFVLAGVGPKAAGFAVAIRFFFAVFEKQLPGGAYAHVTEVPWPAIIGIISAVTMT